MDGGGYGSQAFAGTTASQDRFVMNTNPKSTNAAPSDDVHLIVAKDEDVVIEHHPEDWIAFVLFWALAFIVFLQFFTRYILNDSLAWTEEIARYGLMWLAFIGGAVVTRKKTQIAVELLGNLMAPGRLRTSLFALVDFVTLGFMGLLAYFSISITGRMQAQTMTVFDLPMSLVYGGGGLRLLPDVDPASDDGLDSRAPALAEGRRFRAATSDRLKAGRCPFLLSSF